MAAIEDWDHISPAYGYYYNVTDDVIRDNVTSLQTRAANLTNEFWFDNGCRAFEFIISTVVIGFLCVVGITGNILSVFVLGMDRQNRVAGFLLQTLSMADTSVLVVSAVVLSGIVGPAQIPEVYSRIRNVIPYLKKYINPFGYVTHSVAIWVVVLLAVNRYIAVCLPFHAHKWLTLRRSAMQVTAVILFSVFVNVPRLFQYDVVYVRDANNETYAQKRVTAFGANRGVEIGYFNAFYTIAVLIFPLICLVGLNAKLIYTLQVSKRNMQRNSLYYIGSQEKNITVVMIIVIIQVLVCHTPDRVITALRQIDVMDGKFDHACPQGVFVAQHFANVLIIVNCSTNFLIYSIVRARFRRNFLRLFCACLPAGRAALLSRRASETSSTSLSNGFGGATARNGRMGSKISGASARPSELEAFVGEGGVGGDGDSEAPESPGGALVTYR